MLYFAYGSNMDFEMITKSDRCPSAQFIIIAELTDYTLEFTRLSEKKWKCGVADIVAARGQAVWGVVYHISEAERHALDKAEGVPWKAYRPAKLQVFGDGNRDHLLRVDSYEVCVKENPPPKPSKDYLSHLLKGARERRLPAHYQDQLQRIATLD